MSVQSTILASRRTILITILGRYEQFNQDYQSERDSIEVETRINKFEQMCKDLESIHQQLEESATTAEERTYNATLREGFEPWLIRLQAALKEKYRQIPRSEGSQHRAGSMDYIQWLTFRDTYECLIHENDELSDIQKFHYLRAAVKGEAAQVIESITISSNNYTLAWKMLTERYSNEYLLKKRHLQPMFCIATKRKKAQRHPAQQNRAVFELGF